MNVSKLCGHFFILDQTDLQNNRDAGEFFCARSFRSKRMYGSVDELNPGSIAPPSYEYVMATEWLQSGPKKRRGAKSKHRNVSQTRPTCTPASISQKYRLTASGQTHPGRENQEHQFLESQPIDFARRSLTASSSGFSSVGTTILTPPVRRGSVNPPRCGSGTRSLDFRPPTPQILGQITDKSMSPVVKLESCNMERQAESDVQALCSLSVSLNELEPFSLTWMTSSEVLDWMLSAVMNSVFLFHLNFRCYPSRFGE